MINTINWLKSARLIADAFHNISIAPFSTLIRFKILNGLLKIWKPKSIKKSDQLAWFTRGTMRIQPTFTSTLMRNRTSSCLSKCTTIKSSPVTQSLPSNPSPTSITRKVSCSVWKTGGSSVEKSLPPMPTTGPLRDRSPTMITSWFGATLTSESGQARMNCTRITPQATPVSRKSATRRRQSGICS